MLPEASPEMVAGLRAFRDRLRILDSIDFDELAMHSIIDDLVVWQAFRRDPFRWLIRADDERAERIWQLIEARTSAAPPV